MTHIAHPPTGRRVDPLADLRAERDAIARDRDRLARHLVTAEDTCARLRGELDAIQWREDRAASAARLEAQVHTLTAKVAELSETLDTVRGRHDLAVMSYREWQRIALEKTDRLDSIAGALAGLPPTYEPGDIPDPPGDRIRTGLWPYVADRIALEAMEATDREDRAALADARRELIRALGFIRTYEQAIGEIRRDLPGT